MQTFLDQPEATFYHICSLEDWHRINLEGIKGKNNEIFVSRVGEMAVLAAIAMEQLDNIYEAKGMAVLKLPQALNNFNVNEIFEDYRAPVERTGVFQNVIRRTLIPVGCFETMMKIDFADKVPFYRQLFNDLAAQANLFYPKQSIFNRAKMLKINKYPGLPEWLPSDAI